MGQIIRDDRVIDFEYKSAISKISLSIMSLKKSLWWNNRVEYNKLKAIFKPLQQYRDEGHYWIMQDPEVTVAHALISLGNIEHFVKEMINLSDSDKVKELLNSELDKIQAIKTAIDLDNHKTSFFKR